MIKEIILAIIQAFTEFLPVSSSGHLAIASKLMDLPQNIFFFTVLHIASLLAVLVYFREEIVKLFKFDKQSKKYIGLLIIGTIPAGIVGGLFGQVFKQAFSSSVSIGVSFLFTGGILFLTKFSKNISSLNLKNSLIIGLAQILALFPGISRSGMTTSFGMLSGIEKQTAGKFSFFLFIPLAIGAMILETGEAYFNFELVLVFLICFVLSYLSISGFFKILRKGYWWIFGIYVWILGLLVLIFM